MLSAQITARKSVQRSFLHLPPLLLRPCQPFPLIWSPVCGCHLGMSFLCRVKCTWHSVRMLHGAMSTKKKTTKGEGSLLIVRWFSRHFTDIITALGCIYTCIHRRTHTHRHTQQIQCCDSRVKPCHHTIIYAWVILLMLLYTIICMVLQSIKGLIIAIIDMIIGYLLIWSAHSSNHRWEETTV